MPDFSNDPLSSVVTLLQPQPSISKMVEAGGGWLVERHDLASPFYCAIVEGSCCLTLAGREPVTLSAGDFVLIPDLHSFTMSSEVPPPRLAVRPPRQTGPGTFRLGPAEADVEFGALVGHCRFAAPGKDLLVSLLPGMVHVCGHDRLMALVPLIHEETRSERPARGMILKRLLEVLMIEALRSAPRGSLPPGLLRGLSDPQLSGALRSIHADPANTLSVAELARVAGMSRSGFFERFRKEVGSAPMEYLTAWRMALAKDLLLRGSLTQSEIAGQVGYGSASAFAMAFVRHERMAPGAFAKTHATRNGGELPVQAELI